MQANFRSYLAAFVIISITLILIDPTHGFKKVRKILVNFVLFDYVGGPHAW